VQALQQLVVLKSASLACTKKAPGSFAEELLETSPAAGSQMACMAQAYCCTVRDQVVGYRQEVSAKETKVRVETRFHPFQHRRHIPCNFGQVPNLGCTTPGKSPLLLAPFVRSDLRQQLYFPSSQLHSWLQRAQCYAKSHMQKCLYYQCEALAVVALAEVVKLTGGDCQVAQAFHTSEWAAFQLRGACKSCKAFDVVELQQTELVL